MNFRYTWNDDPAWLIMLLIKHEDGDYRGARLDRLEGYHDESKAGDEPLLRFDMPACELDHWQKRINDAAVAFFEQRLQPDGLRDLVDKHERDKHGRVT